MLFAFQNSGIRTLHTLQTTSYLNPVLTMRNLFTRRLGSHWPMGAGCNCVFKKMNFFFASPNSMRTGIVIGHKKKKTKKTPTQQPGVLKILL